MHAPHPTEDVHPTHVLRRGRAPLLISIPHLGTTLPEALRDDYTPLALTLTDTDWHLDRLYAFATQLDATLIAARISRYVIDLNRPSSGESLYPGQATTGLCPTTTFDGQPLYRPGREPGADEIARRVETWWAPYHAALETELARLRGQHPDVLLWEAHSIASHVPRLFDGKLPDLNFGTHGGLACAPDLLAAVTAPLQRHPALSWVVNGRFKGGHITRHHGQPQRGIHAIQLEMCQCLYMDEQPPFTYQEKRAAPVQQALQEMLQAALGQLGQAR